MVEEFHVWFCNQGAQFIWSQGGNFDEPLWVAAAVAVNSPIPWKYYNTRCTRTAYHLAGFDPRTMPRDGTHHNAIDDARYQIHCVQESYRRLREAAFA